MLIRDIRGTDNPLREQRNPPPSYPRCGGNHTVRQPINPQGVKVRALTNQAKRVTAKARPPNHGGRAALLRLQLNGGSHEGANCSPGRQELQGIIVDRSPGHSGSHSSSASGLVWARVGLVSPATPNFTVKRTLRKNAAQGRLPPRWTYKENLMSRSVQVLILMLLSTLSNASSAQLRMFGSWGIGPIVDNEGVYAATINDSEAIFGQYCYPDKGACYWLLANDIDCDTGSKYPVLVNTDSGASSLELLCFKLKDKGRYAFTDFDAIDKIARGSTRLGIAFPMQNGLFQVHRFSLDGSTRAVDVMREAAEKLMKSPTNTKDRTL